MDHVEFGSDFERVLFEQNQALKRDRDRLLRDKDSLQQDNNRLREMIRGRSLREERVEAVTKRIISQSLQAPPSCW